MPETRDAMVPERSGHRFRAAAMALLALAVAPVPAPAPACGLHEGSAAGLTVAHASSLPVAMAIGDAIAAGRLQSLADVPAQFALMRASLVMRAFAGKLDPAVEGLPPIAVVLVEAHLWGRATSGPGGPRFAEHVPGPSAGDVIVVTGEPALGALLAGRLSWDAALASGLVVVDGPPEARDRLARLVAKRLS